MISTGMNLADAVKAARELGCSISEYPGTGEIRIVIVGRHPLRLNRRRKDAPRILTSLLRQLEKGKL